MRRVLLITYYFPPSSAAGAFRALGFARHLREYGWEPVVVAPGAVGDEPVDEHLLDRLPAGTRTILTGRPRAAVPTTAPTVPSKRHLSSGPTAWAKKLARVLLLRPHGKLEWLPRALSVSMDVVRRERIDAVYSTIPPSSAHLVGHQLKMATRLPWVADFRDPWEFCAPEADLLGIGRSIDGFYRQRVIQAADIVIGTTDGITALNRGLYAGRRKPFVTITNGYDPEDFRNLNRGTAGMGDEHFVVCHVGELYAGRDLSPFLAAVEGFLAADTTRRGHFRVQFVGRTDTGIESLVRERGLADVVALPGQVSHRQALQFSVDSTALLLIQGRGYNISVPSKLYEYMACARPVLALVPEDSQTAHMLRSAEVPHLRVDLEDTESIRQGLESLYRRWLDKALDQDRNVQSWRRFSRRALAGQLAECLDSLV